MDTRNTRPGTRITAWRLAIAPSVTVLDTVTVAAIMVLRTPGTAITVRLKAKSTASSAAAVTSSATAPMRRAAVLVTG